MTHRSTLKGTLLFHLNLSYSAIEVEQRGEVVRRAYGPMLALAEEHPWLRLGVEATGHTLARIAEEMVPFDFERWGTHPAILMEASRKSPLRIAVNGPSKTLEPTEVVNKLPALERWLREPVPERR